MNLIGVDVGGSAIKLGAIDEEGLFDLRARGVPKEIATDLLTLAFLAEAVQEIADRLDAHVRDAVLAKWFPRCLDRTRGGFRERRIG